MTRDLDPVFDVVDINDLLDLPVKSSPPADMGLGGMYAASTDGRPYFHNGVGWQQLAYTADTGAGSDILAGTTNVVYDQDPDTWFGPKPLVSDGSDTIYVDSANGNDANDGSSGNPVQSLAEAFGRVPYYVHHTIEVRIVGDYTKVSGAPAPELLCNTSGGNDGHVRIIADSGTNDIDLQVDGTTSHALNIRAQGNEPKDCCDIVNLSFTNCRVKPRNSSVRFLQCTFNSDTNSVDVPVAGYHALITVEECTWNSTQGAVVPAHERVYFNGAGNGNSGTVDWLVSGGGGAGVEVIYDPNDGNSLTFNNSGVDGSGYLEPGLPGPCSVKEGHLVVTDSGVSSYGV